MRIAQVSPLHESVPPRLYGGTERVVHYLTEELVRMGHEVTLFASGDSQTAARLIAPVPRSLRLAGCRDPVPSHTLLLEQVLSRIHEFDIVHFHTDAWHFPVMRRQETASVTTMHGRLDIPELEPLLWEYRDRPLLSISDAQREPAPWCNWQATIYHGLPVDLLEFTAEPRGQYLAFTGRISPEKRPDLAIEIAQLAGIPLRIAAKVDAADQTYFDDEIRPLLDTPGVEFIGEISDREKADFIGNAAALLFPIDWPEPFGLVMIEAMSCGTPVVAMRRGSVPEVIDHGQSGFIVDTVEEAVRAVRAIVHRRDEGGFHLVGGRRGVRAVFETRFAASRMAEDYLRVYRRLCGGMVADAGGVATDIPRVVTVGAERGRNR